MARRIDELDFLKCVFIVLMVTFHLIYIGDKYPYAKQLVYTFHIPAFLLISGYLVGLDKTPRAFLRNVGWMAVPYVIMESGYIVMSAVLPVRDGLDRLDVSIWANKLLLHPLGPYWYLHTLMVGSLGGYWAYRCRRWLPGTYSLLLWLAAVLGVLSVGCRLAAPSSLFYLGAGMALRICQVRFTTFFQPSWGAFLFLAVLALDPEHLDRFTLAGVAITYLAISASLAVYASLGTFVRRCCLFVGQNTFVILVFSPLFTLPSRWMVPWFRFDDSGLVFWGVALAFVLGGCFGVAALMDRWHLSHYFWGKERMLQRFGRETEAGG